MDNRDLVVIGSGPGGYVAAIRAAQLGMKTTIIERDRLGGVCLNWGCIPTKTLMKSAEIYSSLSKKAGEFGIVVNDYSFDFRKIIRRSRTSADMLSRGVEFLLKKNKVQRIKGTGRLVANNRIAVLDESNADVAEIAADKIILATGGRPRSIPGVAIDGKSIWSSAHAMTAESRPDSLIVIGAGAIGVEFAYFYNALGADVTVVEMLDAVLPAEDEDVSKNLERILKRRKMKIMTSTRLEKIEANESGVVVTVSKANATERLEADKVLVAIGVRPNTEEIGLEEAGVRLDNGWIRVNKNDYSSDAPCIYAIGDVIGAPWLAHVASAEAICCVEKLAGRDHPGVDYNAIPGCTYCVPPVAGIGLTEKQALANGFEIRKGTFPFMACGKAKAVGEKDGFVKVLFDAKTDRLLGAHILGGDATEMIAEFGIAMRLGAGHRDFLETVHAHPTMSEAMMEAVAAAYGEAIHL